MNVTINTISTDLTASTENTIIDLTVQPYVGSINSSGSFSGDTDGVPEGVFNLYYTDERVSGNTAVLANTAKTGITASQASDIETNNAKISYTDASQVASNISNFNSHTGDTSIHFTQGNISITESQISDLQAYSLTGDTAITNDYVAVGTGAGIEGTSGLTFNSASGNMTLSGGFITGGGSIINGKLTNETLRLTTEQALGGTYSTWFDEAGSKGFFGFAATTNEIIYLVNQEAAGTLSFGTSGRTDDLVISTDGQVTVQSNIGANSFITSGGLSSEFVKGDGSLDSNVYSTTGHTHTDRIQENSAVSGATNTDWGSYEVFDFVLSGNSTFTDINLPSTGSKVITIYMIGDYAPTYPAGWSTYISGTYDGTVLNTIVVDYVKAATPFYKVQITQPD